MAVEDDFLVGQKFLRAALLKLAEGDQLGAGDAVKGPFVLLAHVDEAKFFSRGEAGLEFLRGDVHGMMEDVPRARWMASFNAVGNVP